MKFNTLFENFFNSEKTAGFILIACTVVSLLIANSSVGPAYLDFWNIKLGFSMAGLELHKEIAHWINDFLMAIFFLMVGLEIEREIYTGELSEGRKALLPIIAALGGMVVPGLIFVVFNVNTPSISGFGVPMATDIAFALGILAMLGSRVPLALKIFLTALAIIDDLGAIILIAIFYVKDFALDYLIGAFVITALLVALNRLKVLILFPYIILGLVLWYCLLKSGVHPTITGVILAFVIPFKGKKHSPSEKLEHLLHKPVAFIILPLFALVNTGIIIKAEYLESIFQPHFLGIFFGLIVGKPLGIIVFSYLAIKTGLVKTPEGLNIKLISGAGVLAGIGFTMAIFISLMAFDSSYLINTSKMAILSASLVAGVIGFLFLKKMLTPAKVKKLH